MISSPFARATPSRLPKPSRCARRGIASCTRDASGRDQARQGSRYLAGDGSRPSRSPRCDGSSASRHERQGYDRSRCSGCHAWPAPARAGLAESRRVISFTRRLAVAAGDADRPATRYPRRASERRPAAPALRSVSSTSISGCDACTAPARDHAQRPRTPAAQAIVDETRGRRSSRTLQRDEQLPARDAYACRCCTPCKAGVRPSTALRPSSASRPRRRASHAYHRSDRAASAARDLLDASLNGSTPAGDLLERSRGPCRPPARQVVACRPR